MADRVLTWHIPADASNGISTPRFYMDADYVPTDLRVYAEKAPSGDLYFDIRADGQSVMSHLEEKTFTTAGQRQTTPTTAIALAAGENSETDLDDFNGDAMPEGTWVELVVTDLAGAKGVTFNLELDEVGEDESEESDT